MKPFTWSLLVTNYSAALNPQFNALNLFICISLCEKENKFLKHAAEASLVLYLAISVMVRQTAWDVEV